MPICEPGRSHSGNLAVEGGAKSRNNRWPTVASFGSRVASQLEAYQQRTSANAPCPQSTAGTRVGHLIVVLMEHFNCTLRPPPHAPQSPTR